MSTAYELSMELCSYIRHHQPEPEEVTERWRRVFEAVLIRERFTRHAIDYMWEHLAQGNWEHMHQTDEEQGRSADDWLEAFEADVFYCSDRYTLDRLTRCHWLWRQWTWQLRKGEE
ncbi:MAG: hypothetical protein IJ131_09725 [Eggerthellaceae bacterium]|nr:hypothetical protein [Eggerthellaceae bacterium]